MKYLNAYSFSIFVIIYTLFNIALGAMVRATGSGAERDTAEEVEAYIEERIPVQ